jgi:hypothetical protein
LGIELFSSFAFERNTEIRESMVLRAACVTMAVGTQRLLKNGRSGPWSTISSG